MKKIFLLTSIIVLAFSSNVFTQPTTLGWSTITPTSAILSWNATPCSPGTVTLHYKVSGTAWPGTTINPATSPYALTGLSSNTTYEWRVKCSGSANWSPIDTFSTSIPEISNAFISIPILCNGDFATDEIQVDITQTTTPTFSKCLVGSYLGAYFLTYYNTASTTGTQLNLNGGFQPGIDYFVRLVDEAIYLAANGNSLSGTSIVGVYDEFGPINFSEPAAITADPTTGTNITCNNANNGTASVVNPSGGTPFTVGAPYTYSWNTTEAIIFSRNLETQSATL